jgi:signal transduction histidine kinase
MTASQTSADPLLLDQKADLQTVLSAWHNATVRLEQTHAALREEVQELTRELEVKNRELARKNRLADLGQMASHVAHEVRNNLVPVTLYLSLLRRQVSADPVGLDILDKVTAGFTALDAMVNDLLNFTSDRDPQRENFPVDKLVEEICAALAPQWSAQAIRLEVDVPAGLRLSADRGMIRRAVLNLVLNAMDAMPDGGTLLVAAAAADGCVELRVADSGQGLSEQALPRVFEPFFTTKPSGTGLGLAIVARIVEVHGGESAAANRPEGGAAFTLRIPQPAPAAAGARQLHPPGAERGDAVAGTVCAADSETFVREVAA